ncbi:LytR/AlgR family response regulator transcription factor [Spirosoma lituiforme]
MKIKQCLIIDDQPDDVNTLQTYLDKITFFAVSGVTATLEEAIRVLAQHPVDLIFLDVQLGDQTGMNLLRSGVNLPPVIITSAYAEYAVDSYEIGRAADYLLKPFTFERLQLSLTRALQFQVRENSITDVDGIFLKMGRRIQRFDYDSIVYIESYGAYAKVYTLEQTYVVNERTAALANLLPSRQFIRVHKSYIINISKITSYDSRSLWIGDVKIPIGLSFKPKLEGILSLFEE